MNKLLYIYGLVLAVFMASCTEDPLSKIYEDGSSWNHERGISALVLKNQIGSAAIVSNTEESTVTVVLNTDVEPNISSVEIEYIGLSWNASADVAEGSTLNFDNEEKKTTITVTSESGKTKEWTVYAQEFSNPVMGEWRIAVHRFSWDDYNGWGNSGYDVDLVNDMPLTATGLDDVITFGAVEGIEDGKPYGTYTRTAGADNEFANYVFDDGIHEVKDWAPQFGQLQGGKGKYYIDEDGNGALIVRLVMESGSESATGVIEIIDETTVKVNLEPTMRDLSLIDWDNYYSTWSHLVSCIGSYYHLEK
ncbi:hypothetical protein [Labilibacter marinus]|uniref:hypothetical protein n=1 Tax=Labilibacter marinus TaxID=1477105 RepID=UPI0008321F96|nr:hypothetical protein [Labilibacter marinus]